MNLLHRAASQCLLQPWKNGGGVTRELALQEHDGRWLWRLSLADVEVSGPFSGFPGYRRTIMLVDGRGMELSFDAAPAVRVDARYRMHTFEGEWITDCRLIDGPVSDLNLIWDRERADARLEVARIDETDTVRRLAGATALVHGLAGEAELDIAGRRVSMDQGDTLRIDAARGAEMRVIASRNCTVAMVAIDG